MRTIVAILVAIVILLLVLLVSRDEVGVGPPPTAPPSGPRLDPPPVPLPDVADGTDAPDRPGGPAPAEEPARKSEPHEVRIRVVDTAGAPVPGAVVWYTLKPSSFRPVDRTRDSTNSEGEVVARHPAGAKLFATVSARGCDPALAEIDLSGPERTHEVEVVVEPEGEPATLIVHVVDERGRPQSAVVVWIADASEREIWIRQLPLDGEGTGRTSIPRGRWCLRYAPPRTSGSFCRPVTEWVDLYEGRTTERFVTMPLGGRIRVTVRNADGTPGTSDGLLACGPDREVLRYAGQVLRPGEYRLEVVKQDRSLARARVRVDAGEVTEVELRLSE